MTAESALWLRESDVVGLLTITETIGALEEGLAREAAGRAKNMVKTHVTWGAGSTLHAIGGIFEDLGVVGTKTWAHAEGGATPLLVLFDAHTGGLLAIIEAFALGQLRTGGISGVATKLQAAPDADELSIIGTGKQALAQVAAVDAVRPLRRVRVFSPNPAHRSSFARRVSDELGLEATVAGSVDAAVDGSPIVTLATRARSPFLGASAVSRGTHVNAVGAIVAERSEFEPSLLDRCDTVMVDSVEQAQQLSRELRDYFDGLGDWSRVEPLSRLVADHRLRATDADCSLFKAMGVGISDLSLGVRCLELAHDHGIGRPIPTPARETPRWRATAPAEGRTT